MVDTVPGGLCFSPPWLSLLVLKQFQVPASGHLPAGLCPPHPSKALLSLVSLVSFLDLSLLFFIFFPQKVRISPINEHAGSPMAAVLAIITLLLPAGSLSPCWRCFCWWLVFSSSSGLEVRHGLFPVKSAGLWSSFQFGNFGSAWLWGGLLSSFVRWADATSLHRADLGQLWSRALLRPLPDVEPGCCVRAFPDVGAWVLCEGFPSSGWQKHGLFWVISKQWCLVLIYLH